MLDCGHGVKIRIGSTMLYRDALVSLVLSIGRHEAEAWREYHLYVAV